MNATDQVLLADVRAALVRQISAVSGKANLDEVFAAWVLGENGICLSVEKAAPRTKPSSSLASSIAPFGHSLISAFGMKSK